MLVTPAPCTLLWPAAMILWGPEFTCSSHSHHSIQLIMALEGSLRIRSGAGQRWIRSGAALVRADAPHEVNGGGVQALFAFVDPESDLGAALSETVTAPIHPIETARIEQWRNALGDPATLTSARVDSWIGTYLLAGRRCRNWIPECGSR
jgi:hypothetical protein